MTVADYVSFALLVILLGAHILMRPFLVRWIRSTFLFFTLAMIATLFMETYLQFLAWQKAASPAHYLLPPFAPINYFIQYVWLHFWLSYLLSFAVALLTLLLINRIPTYRRERIFETDEPLRLMLCLFLLGHPQWLIYAVTCLLIYIIASIVATLRKKQLVRISLYQFWIPLAVIIKIATPLLFQFLPLLAQLQLSS